MPSDPPKVFISYSHDSPEHARRVLGLAERLRKDGVDACIDQYVVGTPVEDWPRWMLNQLDWANFVLVVCTETYYRRFRGHEHLAKGKGADWEGNLITLELYHAKGRTTKFAPVLFDVQNEQFIPEPVSGHTHYPLDSEDNYDRLYAFLVGQACVPSGELGPLKSLARKPVEHLKFGTPDTPTRRTIHNLPFPPNPAFTGRDSELKDLRKKLRKRRKESAIQTFVVHGLGGVGKTQLVVQYAWKHLRQFDAVFWMKADGPEALDASLAAIAPVLRLPEAKEREQSVQLQAVLGWLADHGRWLLIADDAAAEAVVRAIQERLPPSLRGAMLVTSRLSRWPVNMLPLPLDLFDAEQAARYLLARVRERQHEAGDEAAARKLAEELGNLPLALEQAASFIIEVRWSFDKYRQQLRDARPELLNYEVEGGTRYPASVAKTWSITLDRLNPLSRSLLRLAAWFAPEAIPRGIFAADKALLSESLDPKVDVSNLGIDKALGELDRLSLIRLTLETVSVHRLLQAVEQDALKDECKRWLEWAVRLFNLFAPESPEDVRAWDVWLLLSPHAETLVEHTRHWHIDTLPVAHMANQFGKFLIKRAAYAQGEPPLKRALAIEERILGSEHPGVAISLSRLARLYRVLGRYIEAEPLYKRALKIQEKALIPEDPDLATSLYGLGHKR